MEQNNNVLTVGLYNPPQKKSLCKKDFLSIIELHDLMTNGYDLMYMVNLQLRFTVSK